MIEVRTIRDRVPADFDGDARTLARQILAELLERPKVAAEVLLPLVAAEVDRTIRERVRITEAEVVTSIVRRSRRNGRPAVDRKALFLRASIALGDGTRITWGEATAEQHLQRIAMLEGQMAGVAVTAERHRIAVAAITEAGVSCLNDLPDVPAGLVAA